MAVAVVLVAAGALILVDPSSLGMGPVAPPDAATNAPSQAQSTSTLGPSPTPLVVHSGLDSFSYAIGVGPVVGRGGELHRYHVAGEDGIALDVAEFAAAVDAILDDPSSWTAGGTVRFQRVPQSTDADFTVYLASPATAEAICKEGDLEIDEYTNCRLSPGKVVINSARWLTAVPGYGASLDVYRGYAINHEVGHQLGYGHELCPGPGQPAPVMQQQTLGLHGCTANAWPYLNGVRYQGPPAPE
jgi:hypothetical protein